MKQRNKLPLFAFTLLAMIALTLVNCKNDSVSELMAASVKYTVSFDANGGTGTMENQIFSSGVKQQLDTIRFIKDQYFFKGWSEDKEATSATYKNGENFTATKNITLYAVWESTDDSLVFTCDTDTYLVITCIGGMEFPKLKYSTDNINWNLMTEDQGSIPFGKDKILYLRYDPKSSYARTAESPNKYVNFGFKEGTKVYAAGDLKNILGSYSAEKKFCGLFKDCAELVTPPVLDFFDTFDEYAFSSMFEGCTSLIVAPKLAVVNMRNSCYYNMFKGCTSLEQAPVLPTTTLAKNCYQGMFEDCTSLIAAPELTAKTLAEGCYSHMFKGCTSLERAPKELPATTLAKNCYQAMFEGCTSLEQAPDLPAITLAESCYHKMFYDCTNLTTAPELRAPRLFSHCYNRMFQGCEKLNSVTMLAITKTIEVENPLDSWLRGTSTDGTLYVNSTMTKDSEITASLPEDLGWKIAPLLGQTN